MRPRDGVREKAHYGFAIDCLLRQVVRDCGDAAPAARAGGEITRHSAGFGVSVWAFPKRRHPGGALDRATAAGFLCGRLRRFGIRAYGIVRTLSAK